MQKLKAKKRTMLNMAHYLRPPKVKYQDCVQRWEQLARCIWDIKRVLIVDYTGSTCPLSPVMKVFFVSTDDESASPESLPGYLWLLFQTPIHLNIFKQKLHCAQSVWEDNRYNSYLLSVWLQPIHCLGNALLVEPIVPFVYPNYTVNTILG